MFQLPNHLLPSLAAFAFAVMASPTRLDADPAATPGDTKESAPKIRLVFLTSLMENDALVLASRGNDGEWTEHGELKARPSFITEWFGVRSGELHLARRTPEGLVSQGRLLMPAGARAAVAIIQADSIGRTYLTKVIDPAKSGFARGSTLLMNLSGKKAMVILGKTRVTVEPGATVVSKASLDVNGMYRMLVGYNDPDNGLVACYDRYLSGNAMSREFLFLIPDENLGLRVLSLSEFGDAD
jgi:hypothetical protein